MSDNSSENSLLKGDSYDLNAKYTRLASEYSKVRAQNTVLKKAVIEEQTKNGQLNETLREKEQVVRKSNQEMESLNFRNSQLSRRIVVLQEEIDFMNKNGKKKSKNPSDMPNGVNNVLMDEEVRKTLIENAKLKSQLHENEEKHDAEVSSLRKEISSLNYELDQSNIRIKKLGTDHQLESEQFLREQQDFKRRYANMVNKLKETEIELSTLKTAHKSYVNEVGPKLEAVTQLLSKRVPFSDEEYASLNKLNVRYSQNSTDENIQNELLQKHFTNLILTFYNIIHKVTLELKQLGFEESNLCIKTLLKRDDEIQLIEKLNACYQFLENISPDCNIPESMKLIIHQFMKSFLDVCFSVYSSYICQAHNKNSCSLEYVGRGLPVKNSMLAFQTKRNKLVEKIVNLPNSQHSLICDEFENLNVATNNLMMEIDNINHKRVQSSIQKPADTHGFKKEASHYLRSLKEEKSEHIPYEEALENKRKLEEYIMLNNVLKEELDALEKAVITLEQEKTHLINECETLKIRVKNTAENSFQRANEIFETTNELGKYLSFEDISPEILAREKEIQHYMNEKLDEIIVIKQEACSKARTLMLECKALQRRLENSAVEKHLLENKYIKSRKDSLELREELSTVSQNYEAQLSVMSEHLANVNEKLALQSEEIDNLKYQLCNKMSRKGKQK